MLTRRFLLRSLPALAVLPRAIPAFAFLAEPTLLIGTGTAAPSTSKGIYAAPWHLNQGTIGPIALAAPIASPTFLAIARVGLDPGRHQAHLYAISETDPGLVTAFDLALDSHTEAVHLTQLNQQPTEGAGPAHVSVRDRNVFVSNYGGGSLTSYHTAADGILSAPVTHIQYIPVDADPIHAKPHAHEATPSPDGRFLLVNDLGSDRIWVYRIDTATALLTANNPPFWQGRHGSGPRHLAFHPNGRWVYNVNELDSTIDLLDWDASIGTLTTHGPEVSTLAADFPKGKAFASEILVSPDGRFVYAGNRRNETIARLDVDQHDGSLSLKQLAPHGGRTARDLTLDPSGRFLLVACQDSNGIVVLGRDPHTGELSAPLHTYPIDSPQCLRFFA